jgi:hypothetical protein
MSRPVTLADAQRITHISFAPTEGVSRLRDFQEREVDYLISLIGLGEEPGLPNNTSEFLRMMRSTDGTGKPAETGGAWCAVTRSHAGQKVAIDTRHRCPYAPHRGARRLTRNIADAGGWIIKPGESFTKQVIIPKGAALCTKHGVWQGHFMTVINHDLRADIVTIVEGNRNNRKTNGKRYAVIDVRELKPAQWRRSNLYGISALWVPRQP